MGDKPNLENRTVPAKWDWFGPGFLRSRLGLFSTPFMYAQLNGGHLLIEVKPRILGKIFGARSFECDTNVDLAEVFLASSAFSKAVGFRAPGKGDAYLLISDRKSSMDVLATAGFNLSWEEEKIIRF